jgi:hypothetical protein
VRFRGARWIAGLFLLFLGRGCYSSVAATPRIDPGDDDVDAGVEAPKADRCVPRKPWEGPGVTGLLPLEGSTALVISGELYFSGEFDTSGADAADPTLGTLMAWRESGTLQELWQRVPAALGAYPWDNPGVTAAYFLPNAKPSPARVVISHSRRWVQQGDTWPAAGTVVDDWVINDAGPPAIDGAVPWQGPGVTATYFNATGSSFTVISQDKAWVRRTVDADPRNWTWDAGFPLAEAPNWKNAQPIAGTRPWEGKGVSAAWHVGPKLFVVSVDRMWTYDGLRWTALGMLSSLPGWSSAPAAGCGN